MSYGTTITALLCAAVVACSEPAPCPENQAPTPAPACERPDPEQAFIDWANQAATPLLSVDPAHPENADLEQIAKAVGDARLVVLSEGCHNSREQLQLHHRVIRHLVTQHGFDTVVTESGLPESFLIDDYLGGGPASETLWQDGVNKMYGAWQEGRALVEWMRQENRSRGDAGPRLHYQGVDIAGFYTDWRPTFGRLTGYLEKAAPGLARELTARLTPILDVMGTDARERHQNVLTPEQRSVLTNTLEAALARIEAERKAMIAATDAASYERALRTAIALVQADVYYHNHRHRQHPETSAWVGLNGREQAMSRNILWVLERRPDAKVVAINHVIHTKTRSGPQDDIWGHFTPMAALLREALGDEMYVIGMVYGGGEFWQGWQRPAERVVAPVPEPRPDGFEQTMGRAGHERFFVDFTEAPETAAGWLAETTSLRENDYFTAISPDEWDGCFYLDRVSPGIPGG